MNVSLIVSSEVQIFTYRSNSSQIIFSQSFNNVHWVFTPSETADIVTEEARRGRVPEVHCSPGVMVVTPPDLSSWDGPRTGSGVLEIVDPARFVCCQTLLVLSLVWSDACVPSVCVSWLCCSWWRTGGRRDRELWCPGVADGCEPSGWFRSRKFAHRKDISIWSLFPTLALRSRLGLGRWQRSWRDRWPGCRVGPSRGGWSLPEEGNYLWSPELLTCCYRRSLLFLPSVEVVQISPSSYLYHGRWFLDLEQFGW